MKIGANRIVSGVSYKYDNSLENRELEEGKKTRVKKQDKALTLDM
ncbi:MAG: hypothetical protein K0S61_4125, partial [Anaerocolumna sp.]|nr:hypothetical protein [Anaerocolumna sp.]